MPFYSEELREEVRSANDIVDVISGYVRLQKRGGSYVGLCPFHNEKTGSSTYRKANSCIIALDAVREAMYLAF